MKALDNAQIDLVPGKGQGLIILLHGPPGSGKTSTAETIAAYTQRPLYAITCGDLGLDPKSVETRLSNHTAREEKWGCVLLLDEADVFLVSRTHRELKRNALVSDSTKKIWNNILNRLEVENKMAEIKVKFNPQNLLDFAEQHFKKRQKDGKTWNGRQLRGKDSDTARESEVRDDYYDPDPDAQPARKNYAATLPAKRLSLELPSQYRVDRAYPKRTRKRQTPDRERYGDEEDEDEGMRRMRMRRMKNQMKTKTRMRTQKRSGKMWLFFLFCFVLLTSCGFGLPIPRGRRRRTGEFNTAVVDVCFLSTCANTKSKSLEIKAESNIKNQL
ncbi:hypothetical protein B0J13DRAFT_525138 [Dactylonectria estremocensis]|uniref:AAA+ ATPase domain-containing protein n=1 Tax=Dactylonectria estremocensis TaxID=1079267 RepID=A0A9P9EW28_9HYPO|nr:hypothetical protein B0J13DRAFT_525138 [Dactylonectria estremocensis]